jgi:two-component system nitrate/nitrite response regulator NarL
MTNSAASVLIASKERELVTRFTRILSIRHRVCSAASWSETVERIETNTHHVVILGQEIVPGGIPDAVAELSPASTETHVIVVDTPPLAEEDQVALFKLGVHGFCHQDISAELLVKAVASVVNGELWMQRGLITRIIDELTQGNAGHSLPGGSVIDCLTPRELEVARMVHKGGNNKTIARKLDISERTVKAHLSSIFRKLNIENRLHLAIFFHEVV